MDSRFEELMEQAYGLPEGETKLAILEEAVRVADSLQDIENGFDARMDIIKTACDIGRGEKAILSFAWCLAQYDKNPEKYQTWRIMWRYKWIVQRIRVFPQIGLEKVDEMLEDLRRRYESLGYRLRPYYQNKLRIARDRGDFEEAQRLYDLWLKEPRDYMSDCAACEADTQIYYLLKVGRFKEAYRVGQPIFKRQVSCQSVPHSTYAQFLLPLLEEGRVEEAADFHQKGYSLIYNKKGFISTISEHLKYLTITDLNQAVSCLEKFLPEALSSLELLKKFNFYLAASILLHYLDEQAIKVLHLPDHVTSEWLNEQMVQIAQQFDQRNGNNYYSKLISEERLRVEKLKANLSV